MEYADKTFNHQLCNINQLLHKIYNLTFPNANATVIEFEIATNKNVSKENLLLVLNATLANNNVTKRLYSKELAGKDKLDEAESVLWDLTATGKYSYTLTTSEYWMSRDEFNATEFNITIVMFDEEDDDEF